MKRGVLFLGSALAACALAHADDTPLPGKGFDASHYEALWTKSPFVVASPEGGPAESPDYDLVGIASFDGVSYANLIDKHDNNSHFLVSGDKPDRGVSLVSITRGMNGADTIAVVQKDGQPLTLKLAAPPANAAPGAGPVPGFPIPGMTSTNPQTNGIALPTPQIPMPGTFTTTPPGFNGAPGMQPPMTRFHRPYIHIPPRVQNAYDMQAAAAARNQQAQQIIGAPPQ